MKLKLGDAAFHCVNYTIMIFLVLVTAYPMYYVIMASFSRPDLFIAHEGLLWRPIGFSTAGYRALFRNPMVVKGMMNTIMLVLAGVSVNLILTVFGAYVLSRRGLMFKKPITIFIILTMFLNGGMIPFFLTVKAYGLYNSFWAQIIPTAINTFNLLIMRTGFENVPESLEESAKIDGARPLTVLFRIILPLSKATIAVIILYYAVGYWNSWFNAMIFLKDRAKFPLQLILREILIQNDTNSMMTGADLSDKDSVGEIIKYAVIVFSTMPIICLYPFLQKYFVAGVMIGAVKG